ncbi:tripartite tricarboxylate transporter substrate binding protein BugE [Pigmentiphaga soli]|uniref:Tripartite tricarboxylate transporter substrate binding protein BugE n=1 Tax=Pigmentiphaga soli TaxID=1007095 RepID=A0ABP8GE54_9BURK
MIDSNSGRAALFPVVRTGSPRAGCFRSCLAVLGAATMAALAMHAAPAAADEVSDYPVKPIRLVIPYATGGVSDTIGRVMAKAMGDALGQSVVAENRGGGGGTIGAAVVAEAPPDGYTLLLTSPPMVAVAPVTLKSLPYDPIASFTAIGTAVTTPNILVVNNDLPVKTLSDLADYARQGGRLSFASAGPGSTGHLSGQILQNAMHIEMTHVPYKSSGQAFPDVISGRVSMVFDSLPSTIGHVRAGKVRPVVVMSKERSSVLPEVPTAIEAGYPAATMNFWMGIEGPARIPQGIVDKLNAAIRKALESPELKKQLSTVGAELYATSPQEFAAMRRQDAESLGKLARSLGLGAD